MEAISRHCHSAITFQMPLSFLLPEPEAHPVKTFSVVIYPFGPKDEPEFLKRVPWNHLGHQGKGS